MAGSSTTPIGAVLAGGASRRMGSDKATILFRGKPMLAHVVAALRAADCEPFVVGRTLAEDVVAMRDDFPGRLGPAAGLTTVLRRSGDRDVTLVAADQPLLLPATVQHLLRFEGDAVVPLSDGVPQATCGIYRAGCLDPLERALESGKPVSLRAILDLVTTREVHETEWMKWGEDGRSWWSLDSPRALAEAENWRPGIDPLSFSR